MNPQDLCNHTKIRLIAAALGHQQCTATDSTEVLIPGTDKRILIGNDTYLARVAASIPPLTAPAPLTLLDELENAIGGWSGDPVDQVARIIEKYRTSPDCGACPGNGSVCAEKCKLATESPAAPAPQQSELTDDRIEELNREAQDQGIRGIAPCIYLARAIEREVAKATPAAPVQTAVPVPRATLLMIYEAMNHMGDILNNMDACEEEDEDATTPAFDAIRALLDDSYVAAPVQAEQAQAEPVKLPSTPEEMIDFIGNQCEVREDAEDLNRVRFQLTVHDLLSAFDWWFDGAAPALPAQAEQVDAVQAAYENAAKVADSFYDHIRQYTTDVPAIGSAIRALASPSTASSSDTSALGDTGGAK